MKRRWAGLLAFLLVIGSTGLTAVTAHAAHVNCGQVITQNTVLDADVGPCPGEGLVLGASDITLDLGGHTVFGAPSTGVGIRIEGTGAPVGPNQRIRVRNGTVTGFGTGVLVRQSADNILERLVVRDNSCHGIQLHGTAAAGPAPALRTVVRENVVRRNSCSGINLFQRAQNSLIERNVVTQNARAGVFLEALGFFNSPLLNTVRQNSVSGNGGDGVTDTGLRTMIVGNTIRANGGNGVRLPVALPAEEGLVEGNQVLGNALNGVIIDGGRRGNTVTANIARGNGSAGGFDLADGNFQCLGNTWVGNRFVTRNQPCIN
jgi:parallel beta-helix repeat protein